MKQCTQCKQVLPLTEFYKTKRHHTGYFSVCKQCWKKHVTRARTMPQPLKGKNEALLQFMSVWDRDTMTPSEIISEMERKARENDYHAYRRACFI